MLLSKESYLRLEISSDKLHKGKKQQRPGLSQALLLLFHSTRNKILQPNQCVMGGTPRKRIVVILYLHRVPEDTLTESFPIPESAVGQSDECKLPKLSGLFSSSV